MLFDIGEKIVYPAYGVGKIEMITEKSIAGCNMPCYVITVCEKDLTITLPVKNAEKVGLRNLIDQEEVEEVLDILTQENDDMPSEWKERDKFNHEKIRAGSLSDIAQVFRDLSHREKDHVLSNGDRKMLESSRELMVQEIAHSRHIRFAQAESLIDRHYAEPERFS